MTEMKEIVCKCGCGRKKSVRIADIKRGWGKYYSKSCKAKSQSARVPSWNNQADDKNWDYYISTMHPFSTEALGQD